MTLIESYIMDRIGRRGVFTVFAYAFTESGGTSGLVGFSSFN